MTAGEDVYVETGISEGKLWHDDGATDDMKAQFFKDCPDAVYFGRFWWIPLEPGDSVVVPNPDGTYQVHTCLSFD